MARDSTCSMASGAMIPVYKLDGGPQCLFQKGIYGYNIGWAAPAGCGGVWCTDGSRTESGPGVGGYNGRDRIKMAISHATVFKVEVLGIMLAPRACGCRVRRGETVTICSDIQVAIRTIGAHRITTGLTLECFDELERL